MFDAQFLPRGSSSDTQVYSPWFRRQADNAVVSAELIATSGGVLTVKVFHKNSEDTGDGSEYVGTSITLSSVGRGEAEFTGLKELVRCEFTCGDANFDWVLFRMLPPVWFDSVDAS